MRGRTIRSPEKKTAFLTALAECASVTHACRALKLGRETVYGWKREDPQFSTAWDAAIELGTDALEDEAVRRAREGTKKPVYQGGKLVGYVREYSDTLLIFLLKGRRPEKYRENAHLKLSGSLTLEALVSTSMAGSTKVIEGKAEQRAERLLARPGIQ